MCTSDLHGVFSYYVEITHGHALIWQCADIYQLTEICFQKFPAYKDTRDLVISAKVGVTVLPISLMVYITWLRWEHLKRGDQHASSLWFEMYDAK